MKEISENDFSKLIGEGKILERDTLGVKVYLLPGDRICKVFRCKRKFSSAQYYPYAQRFADNCKLLNDLAFKSVNVSEVYKVANTNLGLVLYSMLPGKTLRAFLKEGAACQTLIPKFIELVVELHKKGVYFRSLHFGNVIVSPEGDFCLIDVSDMTISGKSLMSLKRARNFKAIFRYTSDVGFLENYGVNKFFAEYIEKSNISARIFNALMKMQNIKPKKKK